MTVPTVVLAAKCTSYTTEDLATVALWDRVALPANAVLPESLGHPDERGRRVNVDRAVRPWVDEGPGGA